MTSYQAREQDGVATRAGLPQLHRETPFSLPVKVLQFGQGNFMRAFFDWQIDLLNERCGLDAGVVIVRPRGRSDTALLDVQDGLFTTLVRGIDENGAVVSEFRRVECVQREINPATMYDDFLAQARNPGLRFIASNTTEAGIAVNQEDRFDDAPAASFPAKLARLLFERYRHFGGAADKGVVLLPCELIDANGPALKAALLHFAALWQLEPAFSAWLEQHCTFCSTLVDRIVTGCPAADMAALEAQLGYRDQFLVAAEYDYLFVIEGPAWLADELKLHGAGLNIRLVDDIAPYKKRKVGILNGGHTALVPVALLCGLATVREAVDDAAAGAFLAEALADEIIPALRLRQPVPEQLDAFAAEVLRRFRNPAIEHRLASIALNSWSKFAARVMPQLLAYAEERGKPPPRLVLALAATMLLYRGGVIELADERSHLEWFSAAWKRVDSGEWTPSELARGWLANVGLWGRDLAQVPGLADATGAALDAVRRDGMRAVLAGLAKAANEFRPGPGKRAAG
jgi:tagaturonate reductase